MGLTKSKNSQKGDKGWQKRRMRDTGNTINISGHLIKVLRAQKNQQPSQRQKVKNQRARNPLLKNRPVKSQQQKKALHKLQSQKRRRRHRQDTKQPLSL